MTKLFLISILLDAQVCETHLIESDKKPSKAKIIKELTGISYALTEGEIEAENIEIKEMKTIKM